MCKATEDDKSLSSQSCGALCLVTTSNKYTWQTSQ